MNFHKHRPATATGEESVEEAPRIRPLRNVPGEMPSEPPPLPGEPLDPETDSGYRSEEQPSGIAVPKHLGARIWFGLLVVLAFVILLGGMSCADASAQAAWHESSNGGDRMEILRYRIDEEITKVGVWIAAGFFFVAGTSGLVLISVLDDPGF